MKDQPDQKQDSSTDQRPDFFSMLIGGLFSDGIKFIIAFLLGTGAVAAVCAYYGIPLVFSVVGGVLVMGIALAVMSDSLFS